MKNKILSLIIIMILVVSPFGMFLDVYATDIALTNLTITVDANNKVTDVTYEEDNQTIHGGTITLEGIGYDEEDPTNGNSDTFKAYKVLDTYYNSTTNEISYQFTTSFQSFVSTLSVAFIRELTNDNTKNTFTVNDYLALTNDGMNESFANTTSTVNILVSKFATYIRNNASGANAITGLPMSNSDYDNDDVMEAMLTSVVPGSYLILPDTVYSYNFSSMVLAQRDIYGVMIANVFFENDQNGDWQISNAEVYAKRGGKIGIMCEGYNISIAEAEALEEEAEANGEDFEIPILTTGAYEIGRSYATTVLAIPGYKIPANTNASLTNNATIAQKIKTYEVVFPQGVNFDINHLYFPADEITDITLSNNKMYTVINEQQIELGDYQFSNNTLTATINEEMGNEAMAILLFELSLNQNAVVGPTGNPLTVKTYSLKDPYMDIGSNPTTQQIAGALEELTLTYNIYTYGIKLSNTNGNNSLVGAEFAVYKDAQCTEQVGSNIVLSNANVDQNGIVYFKGLNDTDTYYLKQVKAPTGYRLYNQVITLKPTASCQGIECDDDEQQEEDPFGDDPEGMAYSLKEVKVKRLSGENEFEVNLDEYGYYDLTGNNAIQNQPILALPFTGGSGTVIYTLIGLFVVIGSITFMALYKKKTKKEVIEEL